MRENGKDQGPKRRHQEDKLDQIIEEVKERGKALLSEGWENARGMMEEKSEAWKEKAAELKTKTVSELGGDLQAYVRKNPAKSVLFAAGIGFLVALLFNPRSND